MLNRRHLRVKVLQAIYAYMQADDDNIAAAEKNLLHSIEKIYDLFLYQISLLNELHFEALKERSDLKNKFFPTEDDLKPQTNFTANKALAVLLNSESLKKALSDSKISWQKNQELVNKMFRRIKQTTYYKDFLQLKDTDFEADREFLVQLYKKSIFDEELIESYYEELNIHWNDDIFVVNSGVLKALKSLDPIKPFELPDLYKDEEEDKAFVKKLFRKTILHSDEYQELIRQKAQNWELDRIALMDIMLMKMAISEIVHFENIPVKVSLNEYIEISKSFSTPKSNAFINGILDKLVAEFKQAGKIKKIGRGLIEN